MIDSTDAAGRADRGRQAVPPQGVRGALQRVPFLTSYLIVGGMLGLAALLLHPISRPLSDRLAGRLLPPYAVVGALYFVGRAVIRSKLRWCRSCSRWLALNPDGERVLRTRPITRRNHGRLEQFNANGQRTGYSRSQTTTRGIRETVAISMICRHCGAKSIVREKREK
jgi:hypothetical protein